MSAAVETPENTRRWPHRTDRYHWTDPYPTAARMRWARARVAEARAEIAATGIPDDMGDTVPGFWWTATSILRDTYRYAARKRHWEPLVCRTPAEEAMARRWHPRRDAHDEAVEAWRLRRREKRDRHIKMHRAIPARVRRELLDQPCAYCGDYATEVDHVVPVTRGGTRMRSNLAPACERCNAEKFDQTPAEWRAWRERIGRPWPPEPRFTELARMVNEAMAAAGGDA